MKSNANTSANGKEANFSWSKNAEMFEEFVLGIDHQIPKTEVAFK